MIVYEQGTAAAVKFAEQELAGRRIVARAFPYEGDFGRSGYRFDPVERVFSCGESTGAMVAGPFDPEVWEEALSGGPAGAVLIGPGCAAEGVRGAYRAAAEGAAKSGRAVYLDEPDPEGLPEAASPTFVAVFVLLPDRKAALQRLEEVASRGFAAGGLLPLISGWTDTAEWIDAAVSDAAAAGARFLAPLLPVSDGLARRRIVEARAEVEPDAADDFFDLIHHGGSFAVGNSVRNLLAAACRRANLSAFPDRARGPLEPPANAAAAARLEERAAETRDEHRASLLHAAARWIDEVGRDLSVVARDGNFRKVFPFGPELARETEEVLVAAGGRATGAEIG
jgi:hypothetical protein